MAEGRTAGRIFVEEFIAKNLAAFDECREHYRQMSPAQLISELEFMYTEEVFQISFSLTSERHFALLNALTEAAGNFRGISDKQRAALVSLALIFRDYVKERLPQEKQLFLEKAFASSIDGIARFGLFPLVGELLEKNVRDYVGEFPTGVIGEILERH